MKIFQNIQTNILCLGMVFIFMSPLLAYSQKEDSGSLRYLNSSKGFGDITLGEDIKILKENYSLNYMDGDYHPDADGCVKYECRAESSSPNENNIAVEMIGIRVYRNKIINIYLFFNRDDGYNMLHSFVNDYGKCSARINDFTYNWDSVDVKLDLKFDSANLGLAVFSSKKLYNEIEDTNRQLAAN